MLRASFSWAPQRSRCNFCMTQELLMYHTFWSCTALLSFYSFVCWASLGIFYRFTLPDMISSCQHPPPHLCRTRMAWFWEEIACSLLERRRGSSGRHSRKRQLPQRPCSLKLRNTAHSWRRGLRARRPNIWRGRWQQSSCRQPYHGFPKSHRWGEFSSSQKRDYEGLIARASPQRDFGELSPSSTFFQNISGIQGV